MAGWAGEGKGMGGWLARWLGGWKGGPLAGVGWLVVGLSLVELAGEGVEERCGLECLECHRETLTSWRSSPHCRPGGSVGHHRKLYVDEEACKTYVLMTLLPGFSALMP